MSKVKLTLSVPEDIVKSAKKTAVDEDVDVSAVVAVFLDEWSKGKMETPEAARGVGKEELVQVGTAGALA
jgi:hypothetical protein